MYAFLVKWFSKIWVRKDIMNCEGDVYLRRWMVLRSENINVYLHCFERSDEDRCLHCHPWPFLSLILWRGYWEHTEEVAPCILPHQKVRPSPMLYSIPVKKRKWPGMILWRPATWKHRVELVSKNRSWTLVVRFNRTREWGFYPGGKFVHFSQWLKENC